MSDFILVLRTLVTAKAEELGDLEMARFLAIEAIKRVGIPEEEDTPPVSGSAPMREPELVLCPQCGDEVEDAFEHESGCPLKEVAALTIDSKR